MEDILGEIHPEGQQTGTTSIIVEREEVELELAAVEEATEDRGQERVRAEEDLSTEQPSTPVAKRPLPIPDFSSAWKA